MVTLWSGITHKVFGASFKAVPWLFQRRSKGISVKAGRCVKEVLRFFQGSFIGVSREFGFKDNSRKFQECLQRSFKEETWVFLKRLNFVRQLKLNRGRQNALGFFTGLQQKNLSLTFDSGEITIPRLLRVKGVSREFLGYCK